MLSRLVISLGRRTCNKLFEMVELKICSLIVLYVHVLECADVHMCADVSVCAFVDHMPMIARYQLWVLLFLLGYHLLHFLMQHLSLALNSGLDLVGWPASARNPPAVVLQWLALKGTAVPRCFFKNMDQLLTL